MNRKALHIIVALLVWIAAPTPARGTDQKPPSAPTNVRATPVSCSQVNVTWSASTDTGSSGLKGYNVYRSGAFVKQVLAPATSASDAGLTGGTAYFYTVLAFDNAGNFSAVSNKANTTTPACNVRPYARAGADQTVKVGAAMTFDGSGSYDPDGSITSYAWTFGDGASASGMTVSHAWGFTGTYTVTLTVTDNVGAQGTDTAMVTVTAATKLPTATPTFTAARTATATPAATRTPTPTPTGDTIAPTAPTGLTGTVMSCTQINLAWGAVTDTGGSGLKGYNVYRNGSGTPLRTVLAPATSTSDTPLAASTVYSYTVRAVDNAGNLSVASNTASTNTPACPVATGAYVWSRRFGSAGNDWVAASAVDTRANCDGVNGTNCLVVTGRVSGTADFGGGARTGSAGNDLFVAKYTAGGTHLWSRVFGGTGDDSGHAVAVDSSGNVIVVGSSTATANFGGGDLAGLGGSDIVVAKYAADGSHLWSKRFGAAGNDFGNGVAVDGSGNVVVAGQFIGTAAFGGTSLTSDQYGGWDMFVAKYTSAGTLQWAKNFSSSGQDSLQAVAVDASGNIAVTGSFAGSMDMGGGQMVSAGGRQDIVVGKLSPTGSYIWAKHFGNTQDVLDEQGLGVAVDATGNVAITGVFRGSVDFGGGVLQASTDTGYGYVAEYTAANGGYMWSRSLGASGGASGAGIATDRSGNVVVAGWFAGTGVFGGPLLVSAGSIDIVVAKYAATTGTHLWSQRYGGTLVDGGVGVAADASGNVVLTGTFSGVVAFGTSLLTSAGAYDAFLLKLTP